MKYVVIILLTASCFAQTQGNAPDLADSFQSDTLGATLGQMAYPEPIAIGDELVVCINMNATNPTPTVTDSLGNTWTMTAGTTPPAPNNNQTIYMAYTNSAFSGADTISYVTTNTSQTANVARFKHLSGVLDGSLATATYTGNLGPSGGSGSFNTSVTTTVNNSLGVTCAGSSVGTKDIGTSNNTEFVSRNSENGNAISLMTLTRTTTAGTYTPTIGTWNNSGHPYFMAQTLFFKTSPTIALADTALPDAINGVAYSAQLHCIGGTAAQTYSLFSGSFPTGISLNTSTGVISGTTTSVGTSSLQFKCTDGTSTSAAQALSLVVEASPVIPSVRQSTTMDSSGVSSFVSPVACGDLIVIYFYGADTHGTNGWMWPGATASSVTFGDSLGTVFRRVTAPFGGSRNAGYTMYVGQALASGSDTVQVHHTDAQPGSGLSSIIVDVENAQLVVDSGSLSAAGPQNSSPYTFSGSFTSVVPNQLLMVAAASGHDITDTLSYSPLSVSQSSAVEVSSVSVFGSILLSSPTTYSVTATVTTGQAFASQGTMIMMGLRPGTSATCSNFIGTGEKIRRVIW